TKGYSGCAPPDGIDVELNRSVAERDALEYRLAAVQSDQTVIKTQLPEELRVLLGLPAVGRHGDGDRFRTLGNRKCRQEPYAERHLLQGIFANKCLHDPSVWTRHPFGERKVTRRTRVLRGGPGPCESSERLAIGQQ